MFEQNPFAYWITYRLRFQRALSQTTADERATLLKYAADSRVIVEIGVWHGVNTRAMRETMPPDGRLFAIDPFPKGRFNRSWQKMIAHAEAMKSQNGEITWMELYSDQAHGRYINDFALPIDFLFIDGDHSFDGVATDWRLWAPLVRSGGRIALHDSRSYGSLDLSRCGAAVFTKEVISKDDRFQPVEVVDSLTVLQAR